ncbi:MAG TPA: 50S ribosomal protein L35 [bacterium]|nr:50S ribosomal protein L35 [bacterium]
MKHKTVKSMTKRFKVTKNGKIIKRKNGQSHLNAKEPGKTTRSKRNDILLTKGTTKNIMRFIK